MTANNIHASRIYRRPWYSTIETFKKSYGWLSLSLQNWCTNDFTAAMESSETSQIYLSLTHWSSIMTKHCIFISFLIFLLERVHVYEFQYIYKVYLYNSLNLFKKLYIYKTEKKSNFKKIYTYLYIYIYISKRYPQKNIVQWNTLYLILAILSTCLMHIYLLLQNMYIEF